MAHAACQPCTAVLGQTMVRLGHEPRGGRSHTHHRLLHSAMGRWHRGRGARPCGKGTRGILHQLRLGLQGRCTDGVNRQPTVAQHLWQSAPAAPLVSQPSATTPARASPRAVRRRHQPVAGEGAVRPAGSAGFASGLAAIGSGTDQGIASNTCTGGIAGGRGSRSTRGSWLARLGLQPSDPASARASPQAGHRR